MPDCCKVTVLQYTLLPSGYSLDVYFLNVVSIWFWCRNHVAKAMRNRRRHQKEKIYQDKNNGIQPGLLKNYVYIVFANIF